MSLLRPALFSAAVLMAAAFALPAQAVETHSSGKQCNSNQGVGGKFDREFFVYFDPSSTALDNEDKAIIREVYERADGQHAAQICLFGKASKTGDPAANASLARGRSDAVAAELRRLGWERGRIAIEPEGETWGWLEDLTWEASEDRRVRIRLSL
jgi:outer membrane protein OmpA-like peptidoglycan-associated protein